MVGRRQGEPSVYVVLRAAGRQTPAFYELDAGDESAQGFREALERHKAENRHGTSVDLHSVEDYRSMRLFVAADGKSGFALHDGDELVSVFSQQGSNRGRAIAASAVAGGARRGDCFAQPEHQGDHEGMLPRMYREGGGFRQVARVEINPVYEHPADAMYVAVLAVVEDLPDVRWFDMDGYDKALAYRDTLLGKIDGDSDAA